MSRPDAKTVEETLRAQILRAGKLEPASLQPHTELVQELGMSSLELLSVLAFAEQKYGVSIRDEDLVSLTTLARIRAKIEELLES